MINIKINLCNSINLDDKINSTIIKAIEDEHGIKSFIKLCVLYDKTNNTNSIITYLHGVYNIHDMFSNLTEPEYKRPKCISSRPSKSTIIDIIDKFCIIAHGIHHDIDGCKLTKNILMGRIFSYYNCELLKSENNNLKAQFKKNPDKNKFDYIVNGKISRSVEFSITEFERRKMYKIKSIDGFPINDKFINDSLPLPELNIEENEVLYMLDNLPIFYKIKST